MTEYFSPNGRLAYVIGFCNGKGGPGKTTLALNSTVELFDQGRRVAFIDGEEGGINADALSRFDTRIQTRRARTAYEIDDAINELSADHDIILFDAPGQTSGDEIATICSVADLVVVPITCAKKDVRGSNSALRMIRRAQERHGGRPESVIVLNKVTPLPVGRKSRVAESYRRQFLEAGHQVAKVQIRNYEWHWHCEFVTREPTKNTKKSSDKAALDISEFVYEVIQSRIAPSGRAANE